MLKLKFVLFCATFWTIEIKKKTKDLPIVLSYTKPKFKWVSKNGLRSWFVEFEAIKWIHESTEFNRIAINEFWDFVKAENLSLWNFCNVSIQKGDWIRQNSMEPSRFPVPNEFKRRKKNVSYNRFKHAYYKNIMNCESRKSNRFWHETGKNIPGISALHYNYCYQTSSFPPDVFSFF